MRDRDLIWLVAVLGGLAAVFFFPWLVVGVGIAWLARRPLDELAETGGAGLLVFFGAWLVLALVLGMVFAPGMFFGFAAAIDGDERGAPLALWLSYYAVMALAVAVLAGPVWRTVSESVGHEREQEKRREWNKKQGRRPSPAGRRRWR